MKDFKDLENVEDIFEQKLTETTVITRELIQQKPIFGEIASYAIAKTKQGRPHTLRRIIGLISNACVTHGQNEFFLSFDLLNALIKQDKHIARGPLSGTEYNAIMRLAKENGFLVELEAPNAEKRLAGLYKLNIKSVENFITSPFEIIEENHYFTQVQDREQEQEQERERERKNSPFFSKNAQAPRGLAKEEKVEPLAEDQIPDQTSQPLVENKNDIWFSGKKTKSIKNGIISYSPNVEMELSVLANILSSDKASYEAYFNAFTEVVGYLGMGRLATQQFSVETQDSLDDLMPPLDLVMSIVDSHLKARFKENDRKEYFRFSGSICQGIRNRCLNYYVNNTTAKVVEQSNEPGFAITGKMSKPSYEVDQDFLNELNAVSERLGDAG